MVSDIDRRKGLSATAAAEVFWGLDTDLLEGGRDRIDPRVAGPPGALGDSVRSGAAHAARRVG